MRFSWSGTVTGFVCIVIYDDLMLDFCMWILDATSPCTLVSIEELVPDGLQFQKYI